MTTVILQNIPETLAAELRDRAAVTGRSVEEVILLAVEIGLPFSGLDPRLGTIIGSWRADPEFDAVMRDFERIDEADWR